MCCEIVYVVAVYIQSVKYKCVKLKKKVKKVEIYVRGKFALLVAYSSLLRACLGGVWGRGVVLLSLVVLALDGFKQP